MYDEIDVKNIYSRGFWTGFATGLFSTFAVCLGAGLYLAT